MHQLAETPVGAFYLIPGTRGACVVSSSAAACGDPGRPGEPMIALAQVIPQDGVLVGAGITADSVKHVGVERRDGSRVITLPVSHGVFVLDESAAVKRSDSPQFMSLSH